jgi:branched-subunit amino acid transport protein
MNHALLAAGIVALGLVTFLYRFSFISAPGRKIASKIPPALLQLLGPTAFTAIMVNNLLSQPVSPAEFRQRGLVMALALPVAYFSRSMLVTVLFGLGLLYFLQHI